MLQNLQTYASFARRFGRRFMDERRAEKLIPVRPAPHRPQPATWRADALTVAWLGHATVLINFFGTWILTDPVMSQRVGLQLGWQTFGVRRLVEPALRIDELPKIDLILLSHMHFDHCDLPTLRRLPRASQVIVQSNNGDLVQRFHQVTELGWGESVTRPDGLRVEAIPARHWGARLLTDKQRGYGGYYLEKNGVGIVFAGDTAHTDSYRQLRGRPIELAIMPIGAYDPYIHAHANPEQAWQMMYDMDAKHILPIHHQTFKLSHEAPDEPIARLLGAAGAERERVIITGIGQEWISRQPA